MNLQKKSNDNSTTVFNKENIQRQYNSSRAWISNQLQEFFHKKMALIYQTPPNHHDAEIHRAASAFGYHPTAQNGNKLSVCPCCQLSINTVSLPISIPTTPLAGQQGQTQFFPLDSGTSMFFTFIKMVIFYLILLFIVSNIYPLHLSYLANQYCMLDTNQCGNSWFIKFSPVKFMRTKQRNYYIMNALDLIMVVGSIVFFMFFRKYQYHIYGVLDLHNLTQDDFTIHVKNIPLKVQSNFGQGITNIEYALRQLFQAKINTFLLQVKNENQIYAQHISLSNMIPSMQIPPDDMQKIKSISLCFDLTELNKLAQERQRLIQYHSNDATNSTKYQKISQSEISIPEINKRQLQICKSFRQNQQSKLNNSSFIGKAFVSFEFQHYRNFILHLYENSPNQFTLNGEQLKIKKATYPSDIIWLNMNVSRSQRIVKIIIFYCILIAIITATFFIIMEVFKAGQMPDQLNKDKNTIGYGFTFLMALINYCIQYVLRVIAKILTIKEKYETKTKQINSLIIKILATQFVSNTLIYFILNFMQGQHYLLDTGLVVQMSNLIIITGLISLPMNFFQVGNKIELLFKKIKYCLLNKNKMLQFQYNEIIQLPQFDFADRYCYYLAHNYTLVFYSYINPICIPFFILIATCHYWIDKYNLLRCSSNTVPMNFAISRVILKTFQLSVLIFAISNYYFSMKFTNQFSLINFIALIIAFGYSILAVFAPAIIQEKVFGNPHEIETNNYTKSLSRGCFRQNYWGCNPATMLIPQPDINRPNQVVDYSGKLKIAQLQDLDDYKRRPDSVSFQ